MCQKLLSLLLLLCATVLVRAQVNIQKGSAEQSFPLIDYTDSKSGFSLGINANYSSGNGLPVNEVASNLGTGWSLGLGGVIARVQIGQPDDQNEYQYSSAMTGTDALYKYPNGYLYNPNVGKGCPVGFNNYPVFRDENVLYKQKNSITADTEQDVFVFQFNGRSGSFVIGRNWEATTLGDSRLVIQIDTLNMMGEGIRTRISQFSIKTEDGIKYTFSNRVLSEVLRYKYSNLVNNKWTAISGNRPSDEERAVNRFWGHSLGPNENLRYIVSAWYLSEMENTNNGEKITFEYDPVKEDVITAKYISHQRKLDWGGGGGSGLMYFSLLSNPVTANKYSTDFTYLDKLKAGGTALTYLRSVTLNKRIKRVVLPNGGAIDIKYAAKSRADLPGQHAIDRIEYNLKGSLIRAYTFNYGYFYKNKILPYTHNFNGWEKKAARLCLLSIQKIGNGNDNATEPPYQFTYYTGGTAKVDDIVPPANALSQDHWGYFNGDVSKLSFTEDHDFLSDERYQYLKTILFSYHNVKDGYAKNGLLRKVTFPTGGSLEYEYKQNVEAGKLVGGVSVSKTTMYDAMDHAKDIVTEYAYVKADGVTSSRWGYEDPVYNSKSHIVYNEKWGGKKYKYPGIEYPEMAIATSATSFPLGRFLISSAIGFAVQWAIAALISTEFIPILNVVVAVFSAIVIIINATKEFEFHRYNLTNFNEINSNPKGNGYERVEVRVNSGGAYNGKTIYEFTAPSPQYPLLVEKLEWPYARKPRALQWLYGLPIKVQVLDKDNKMVSEKTNNYASPAIAPIANADNINCKCANRTQFSIRADDWESLSGYYPIPTSPTAIARGIILGHGAPSIAYYYYTGRMDLASYIEKTYTNGQLAFTSSTKMIIDPLSLLQKGTVLQKDKKRTVVQLSYYPLDYDASIETVAILKQNNAIHTPIATETWLLENGTTFGTSTPYLLDASVTEYSKYTFNGKTVVKPSRTYVLKTAQPIPASTIGFQQNNKNTLLRHPEYFKVASYFTYDDKGNLVMTKSDEQITSYLNDHSDRYIVATAVNAFYNQIAYTSFEGDGKGAWNFNTSDITNTGFAGQKSLQLSSTYPLYPNISLTSSSGYILTYWHKSTGTPPTVNGAQGELLVEGPDGWKLYKHTIASGGGVNIIGAGLIDEVRLHPKEALMSTVTYKEGVGKVAEADANNRLLFYEYDALGRLKLIKDQNKNIIKTYEYNYKN